MPLTTGTAGALVPGARKGWFKTAAQDGDRTLEEQLLGLDALAPLKPKADILDLGCAEGLILLHLMRAHGARHGAGVSIVPGEIAMAKRLADEAGLRRPHDPEFGERGQPAAFAVADLGDADARAGLFSFVRQEPPLAEPNGGFDLVLLLSILHKVADPAALLAWALDRCATGAQVAIRLPSPIIDDQRSGWRPFDVRPALAEAGFALVAAPPTCRGEWLGIYRRSA